MVLRDFNQNKRASGRLIRRQYYALRRWLQNN